MKELYQTIQKLFRQEETIKTFHALHLPVPEFIDLYDGQPEAPDNFEFTTPALFIDYAVEWERRGAMRIGQLTLDIHALTDPTPETDNLPEILEGMEKIDYYETISNLLEDLSTSETSPLVLKSERPVNTEYFNYHLLTFTCTISRRRTNITSQGTVDEVITEQKKYIID